MDGGDMIASAVVKNLTRKLRSELWGQIGFDDDMMRLKITLEKLAPLLGDAEKKSLTDFVVEGRLKDLKSAAYDIEDMMFEFESNSKIWPQNRGKDWRAKLLPTRMKRTMRFLLSIAESLLVHGFEAGTGFDKEVVIKETDSFSDINEENPIIGRDEDRQNLLSILMQSDTEDDVSIISIVGPGGIGKSTLAWLLYNDENVKETFTRRTWVYVSTEYDLKSTGKDLLESFGGSSSGQRYFIVLDNLREEDEGKLEELRGMMLSKGMKGSKIIITTRIKNVVQFSAAKSYELKVLSEDNCWNLFSQIAFTSESENDKKVVEIGKEIANKCIGIPLAAKALGYTMRLRKGVYEWSDVRDSEIWKYAKRIVINSNSIPPSLSISYYYMPSELKLCFAYCSIFPKGCRISKNELIQQWIALGFILPTQKDLSLEEHAEEYVKYLLGMSFLQFSTTSKIGGELCMHDLVHDLARSIMQDELLVWDAKVDNTYVRRKNYQYALGVNVTFEDLTDFCRTSPNLRAIHIHRLDSTHGHSPKTIVLDAKFLCIHFHSTHGHSPKNIALHAKFLRIIHFHSFHSLDVSLTISTKKLKQLIYLKAPNLELIGSLHNLRNLENLQALDFSYSSNLCSLPDSIGKLRELKYLNLSYCNEFQVLPSSIGYLSKLSYLELQYCNKLQVLPESFGNLLNLRFLNMSCCGVKDLPDSSGNLTTLKVLKLGYCFKLEILPESFGNLVNLRYLDMSDCRIRKLPETFVNLTNLEVLKLNYCSELQVFPETFALSSLKELYLRNCENLMNVSELSGHLTNLRKLDLRGCPLSLDNPRSSEIEIVEISFHENASDQDVEEASLSTKTKVSFESQNEISLLEDSHLPIVIKKQISLLEDSHLPIVIKKLEACVLPTVLRSTLPSFQQVFIKIEGSVKEVKNTFLVMQSFITIEGQQSNSITFKAWMDQSTKSAKEVEELVDEYASLIRETKEKPTGDKNYNDSLSDSWEYIAERFKQTTFLLQNLVDLKDKFCCAKGL